jgi:hypothetical protein
MVAEGRSEMFSHSITSLSRGLAVACLILLSSAATAVASPALHERTIAIPGTPCSVTAWDYFSRVNGASKMNYGGGSSCAGAIGQRTIDVVPQVFKLGHGRPLWFTIGGTGLVQGPTRRVRASSGRGTSTRRVARTPVRAIPARTTMHRRKELGWTGR